MAADALFDLPAGARVEREPVAAMTPGERMRARQLDRMARGIHPLSKPGWAPIPLHRDAAPALDKDAAGLRCSGCRFRQVLGHHDRAFPKCVLPDSDGDRMRATHSASSDVRTWWPACRDYQPKDAD